MRIREAQHASDCEICIQVCRLIVSGLLPRENAPRNRRFHSFLPLIAERAQAFRSVRQREVSAHYPELMKGGLALLTAVAVIFTIAAAASSTWVAVTYDYKDGRDEDEHANQGAFVWENSHKIPNLQW